jgi:hypothetical protein
MSGDSIPEVDKHVAMFVHIALTSKIVSGIIIPSTYQPFADPGRDRRHDRRVRRLRRAPEPVTDETLVPF